MPNILYPRFTRYIRLYVYTPRVTMPDRYKLDYTKATSYKVMIENEPNGVVVHPQIMIDNKWVDIKNNNMPLLTLVPYMSGYITKHKVSELEREWSDWLYDFCKMNNLNIKKHKQEIES
jgi:hypothetical protein